MQKLYWVATNIYGKVFGWSVLAPIHHAVCTFSLHALGYGNMYHESWTGEEWFLKKHIKKSNPKIIFDVGANIGNYSRQLLEYTDAQIYSFEPNPTSFSKLSELPEQVVKINKAVSDTAGKASLYFRYDCDGMASLDGSLRNERSVEVDVIRLDEYCRNQNIESIDYLKIDTEGYEREVLIGLGSIRPNIIQFEFNINHLYRRSTLCEIAEILLDYDLYRLLPNGWVKVDPKKYLNNIFIFSNYVAIKNK